MLFIINIIIHFRKIGIDTAFRRFDRENKGYVTSADAKSIMREYGFSDMEIDQLIRLHDKNQDGKLQYSEFVQFWTGGSGHMTQQATPSYQVQAPAAQPARQQSGISMSPR